MPNETGIPDGETWFVLDYFATYFIGSYEVIRVTKTQLVTRHGTRFRKPENLEDGAYLHRVGGNDHHAYKFRKIIRLKKVDPVKM